ncbi:aryl-sulfate sulfotransferase [Halogeometricum luteum]|uniref:Arylsulfotransferase family protein n=1 Tax=Halogeometricum luteum TaxID=2950537 RepID=A0ABU2G9A2_9EURY|nr:aryl-sulfate sulfotransferase [Halogeometricum sp. S3BR5-2]MDS0296869.1 arylsulfotransferase family protein [Halogeometricum sp. S3BR5-2]
MKPALNEVSRSQILRGIVLLIIIVLLAPTAVSAFTYEPTSLQRGTIESPANGTTVISVQGFKIAGQQSEKKPARLVGVGPRGNVEWVYNGGEEGIVWFYDIDPLENGSLLITGTKPGETVVTVWNPQTKQTAWSRTFDWEDTHDIDLINGDQLLVANMRNYNESTGKNDDRLLIYDLSKDKIVWEWKFRNHGYNRSGGGKYTDDWSHVNDVDKFGPGQYLASPRNFDQVIVVNRSTKNVTQQLGSDGDWDTLYEQHNPQYLESENGTPTLLVADSENDRIVEYAKTDGNWTRTWLLRGSFNWPRDADRLPNGNTLVTDTLNHRVMEVTPSGEIVWEFYAPWGTYEAERMQLGDEPGGPTIRDQNATGTANLTGSAALTPGTGDRLTFAEWVTNTFAGTPIESEMAWLAERWAHITPWIRPVWMGPWDFARTILAGGLLIGWITIDGVYHRTRIIGSLRDVGNKVKSQLRP